MKILVLDNYDSFTYNLVKIIRDLGFNENLEIIRNDKISLEEVDQFDKILISPGPGIPDEAGIMKALIKTYAQTKSILGICLGHQGIAEVFGAELLLLDTVLHGIANRIEVIEYSYLFNDIPETFQAGHYHSWTVNPESINGALKVLALDEDENIMALCHKKYDLAGLQFHPESVLTPVGETIIKNWINNSKK